MLEFFGLTEMHLWLLGTAVVFTYVGKWMHWRANLSSIIEQTIDNLIEDGYVKTRLNKEGQVELVHCDDWQQYLDKD